MRFLLTIVSLIFSWIFFLLYISNNSKDIAGNVDITNSSIQKFSPEIFFFSVCFFIIWVVFFVYFSNFTQQNLEKIKTEKYIGKIVFLLYVAIVYFFIDMLYESVFLFILVSLFFISSFIFNFFLFIPRYRKLLKYIGLFSLYISTLLSMWYLYDGFNILAFIVLLYSSVFNFLFHKKYTNYVSFIFSIISILFLIYFLYFFLFELYIEYIYIYFQQLRNYD